jgi:A/G-specific adenine glycosylase
VLKLWEGLGYYSRARNLHRLAQAVVALPAPPRTPEAWRELPGVGPYTAAAITSISFGAPGRGRGRQCRAHPRPPDGRRPDLSRRHTAVKAFTALADQLLPAANPGDHNQAMMELGATVCFRQNPLLHRRARCSPFAPAQKSGDPTQFPRLAAKQMEKMAVNRGWCEHRGRLLLHRTDAAARRLASLHELPAPDHLGLTAAEVGAGELLARKKRGITRYQITESIHRIATPSGTLRPGLVWVPLAELETITLSGPHRRWVREILARENPGR